MPIVHARMEETTKGWVIDVVAPKAKFFCNANIKAPNGVVVVQLHELIVVPGPLIEISLSLASKHMLQDLCHG